MSPIVEIQGLYIKKPGLLVASILEITAFHTDRSLSNTDEV